MFKFMGKKIITILCSKNVLILTYENHLDEGAGYFDCNLDFMSVLTSAAVC